MQQHEKRWHGCITTQTELNSHTPYWCRMLTYSFTAHLSNRWFYQHTRTMNRQISTHTQQLLQQLLLTQYWRQLLTQLNRAFTYTSTHTHYARHIDKASFMKTKWKQISEKNCHYSGSVSESRSDSQKYDREHATKSKGHLNGLRP